MNEKNGEKLKKSFGGVTIGRSPRLDGRSNSRLLIKDMGEMENISIFGSKIKVLVLVSNRKVLI